MHKHIVASLIESTNIPEAEGNSDGSITQGTSNTITAISNSNAAATNVQVANANSNTSVKLTGGLRWN